VALAGEDTGEGATTAARDRVTCGGGQQELNGGEAGQGRARGNGLRRR
jgi:hypothetical protein